MAVNLLDDTGDFSNIAIDARAKALHRASISRGDKGETATLEYWMAYCWRIARQQYELRKNDSTLQNKGTDPE